jgi:hypothetical protein
MSQLSISERVAVAKMLGKLGSKQDAEALRAARKANAFVNSRKSTWADLLGVEATPAVPDHVRIAQDLLVAGKASCTPWELRFLRGILAFKILSPQQRQTLEGIRAKLANVQPTN